MANTFSTTPSPFTFDLPILKKNSVMSSSRKSSDPSKQASASASASQPRLPESESRLRCASKRSLNRALRQAHANPTVSNWLFNEINQPFHHLPVLSPSSFENCIGLHVDQTLEGILSADGSTIPMCSSLGKQSRSSSLIQAGKDILFVPVMQKQGKLFGYTFGGVQSNGSGSNESCPLAYPQNFMFSHFVGRFVFDATLGDVLIVAKGPPTTRNGLGIINIRVGTKRGTRERYLFIAPPGQYSTNKFPDVILAMVSTEETRISSLPRYQFAINVSSGGSSSRNRPRSNETDINQLIPLMAHLERLLKGNVTSNRHCLDEMDPQTGVVTNRRTAALRAEFDVLDAVKMQVFKDTSIRAYYSYMASVASKKKRG